MPRVLLFLCLPLAFFPGCSLSDDDDSSVEPSNDDDSAAAIDEPCAFALQDVCADEVVEAPGADPSAPFLDPFLAVNGVRGGGANGGGLDVFSRDWADANSITLSWSGRVVLNGDGADLVVFENAFESSPGVMFMDLAVVEVSMNGLDWATFPHDYVGSDESEYSSQADAWQGFAGRSAVLLHEEDNRVDPMDPGVSGGDPFDLDDLPAGEPGDTIRLEGFRLVRIVSAPSLINPDTGEPFVADAISNGFDLDGVYAAVLEESAD